MLQVTEKCLPPILQLQKLKELILVGCSGIDDEGLVTLKQGCRELEVPFFVLVFVIAVVSFLF